VNNLQPIFNYQGNFGCEDCFVSLALALECAHKKEHEKANGYFNLAQQQAIGLENDVVFNSLYGAARMEMAWIESLDNHEFSLHSKFKEQVHILISGAEVIEHKRKDVHNQPDVWVNVNGIARPVEIKKHSFDNKALKQLSRYIKVFSADIGYAVAPKLTTPLPSNIIFIPLMLKEIGGGAR